VIIGLMPDDALGIVFPNYALPCPSLATALRGRSWRWLSSLPVRRKALRYAAGSLVSCPATSQMCSSAREPAFARRVTRHLEECSGSIAADRSSSCAVRLCLSLSGKSLPCHIESH